MCFQSDSSRRVNTLPVFLVATTLTRQQLGGYTREIGYDSADRIKTFTHVVTATSAAAPDRNQSFQYDALGRLISYSLGTTSWTIAYDANGNRTATALNGASTRSYTIEATSNRLMTVTSPLATYTYDATGNVVALGMAVANYDLSGRWASMAAGGGTLTGTINVMGQRVRKYTSAGSGSVSLFVYDQRGQLLGEYDHTGAAIREYIWLGNTPVAMFTPDGPGNPPNIFFVETDHIDTPRIVVDRNKAVRWTWLAEPFGTSAADENPAGLGAVTLPLRFPGQYFDQETGTHYNYFRDYDPWAGRYLQSDPVGLAGGLNTYAYVGGNPLSFFDPFGLVDLDIGGAKDLTVHGNPGPNATDFRGEHNPPHFHMGGNDGPRWRTDTWEPYSKADAERMTRRQRQYCENMSEETRNLVRSRQQEVFNTGRFTRPPPKKPGGGGGGSGPGGGTLLPRGGGGGGGLRDLNPNKLPYM